MYANVLHGLTHYVLSKSLRISKLCTTILIFKHVTPSFLWSPCIVFFSQWNGFKRFKGFVLLFVLIVKASRGTVVMLGCLYEKILAWPMAQRTQETLAKLYSETWGVSHWMALHNCNGGDCCPVFCEATWWERSMTFGQNILNSDT